MEYNDYGVKKYLKLLSKKYKNIEEVSEEIINLQAIMNLPKGTELFVSDIHGDYNVLIHTLNNGAGIIRSKIEGIYKETLSEDDRKNLATLIYYPEEKLTFVKKEESNMQEWYTITLNRLVEVCREVTTKYTRSKVRKALPKSFDFIIDELLNVEKTNDKEKYRNKIIQTIIDIDRADEFIIDISNVIKRMAVDHLHVIGDIYDRGKSGYQIMEKLIKFHSLDIQWGNHDILWMGAACGNKANIANVIRLCAKYDILDTLEDDYGINLRPLYVYALKIYGNDKCSKFISKNIEGDLINSDKELIAKIHKAIAIISEKLEGQLILKHPEYDMEERLLLNKIDYKNGTIKIDKQEYKLNDTNFPTVNPENPYELTQEENEIIEKLKDAFMQSEALNKHIQFLYSKGSMYKIYNSNLLYHGCIPMDENGKLKKVQIFRKALAGKNLIEYMESIARKAYLDKTDSMSEMYIDYMWYLWCGTDSPLFGKDKYRTFEKYFIDDKEIQKENKNAYYKFIEEEKVCNEILENFGINSEEAHIINGHIPINYQKGEYPIRANGKLIIIGGGLPKKYQKEENTSGYTLTYNSFGLLLSSLEPFESKEKAIEYGIDVTSEILVKKEADRRKLVADTDIGRKIKGEVADLTMLLRAYKEGLIKENL